ncbi:MAG: SDR family oxidoreductase [Rhodospirillaceae bacterium]|jgi:3-oxoacyl-[acyl-carrier protein] reductase|nr:SDR family oxidoreductase [Rhodospirillaceae bacterium]MBT5245528.1 SDR family oxidoreductase [Rhodospirillaceae bacterium]MBT5561010.1 SDR family oxidoreductase [Rhodospirillaceae bacterium]MBT6240646.1 SDR family oxidoreductase [Rhodospirillaceae bacterium]
MDLGLQDKIVVVAGSSGGIGLAIADCFLSEGARVHISARNKDKLEDACQSLRDQYGDDRVLPYCGDLSEPPAINEALDQCNDHFGSIDAVVANIGSGKGTTGWDLKTDDWNSMIKTNLVGGMLLASSAVPYLKGRDNPSITFISSIAGCQAIPAPIPYSAAKAALQMAAKNLSRQLGADDIRVNTVAPGNVLFAGGTWDQKIKQDPGQVKSYIETEVPLGRFAEPQEIADSVVFLASRRARFITGTLLTVDGGQTR